MPCVNSKTCLACGSETELLQCQTCSDRLKGNGTSQALCVTCIGNPDELMMFGNKSGDAFICNPCVKFVERKKQEELFQTLKGPSSEKILRTVSSKFPWALTIAQASPDELLDALQTCKRKLSGCRTVSALADNLANSNSHAALLLQNLGENGSGGVGSNASLVARTLRTFVKNQCPSVKYKSLLLPPTGSIHKATRHFQDMLKVEDSLVAALAQERIFLCEWAESTFRPTLSEKQRRKSETPELPEFALRILRCTLKSLSTKIKNAASKDDDAEMMVKAWYADHINWATTWALMEHSPAPPTQQMQQHQERPKKQVLAITAHGEPRQPEFPPKGSGKRGKSNGGDKGNLEQLAKVPRFEQPSPMITTSFDVNSIEKFGGNEAIAKTFQADYEKARVFWRDNCRNCYLAGKGFVKHNLYECQKIGNKCLLKCTKCKTGIHWINECKA